MHSKLDMVLERQKRNSILDALFSLILVVGMVVLTLGLQSAASSSVNVEASADVGSNVPACELIAETNLTGADMPADGC